MKKPNFFILGAPKCGTTSLATWLAQHPQIYLSPVKEPFFFDTDLRRWRRLSLSRYEELFVSASSSHVAVGEASTTYLYSRDAVPQILTYASDPKFIVCLRNPIEMAQSFHQDRYFDLEEVHASFEEAWSLQDARRAGQHIPPRCIEPTNLLYTDRCLLGLQVERLLSRVCRSRVLFLLLEDMQNNPGEEYRRVLHFLGASDDGRHDFPVLNKSKNRKSLLLQQLTFALFQVKMHWRITNRTFGFGPFLDKWNRRDHPRHPISDEMRKELQACFREDILKLGALLNRDLRHWLS